MSESGYRLLVVVVNIPVVMLSGLPILPLEAIVVEVEVRLVVIQVVTISGSMAGTILVLVPPILLPALLLLPILAQMLVLHPSGSRLTVAFVAELSLLTDIEIVPVPLVLVQPGQPLLDLLQLTLQLSHLLAQLVDFTVGVLTSKILSAGTIKSLVLVVVPVLLPKALLLAKLLLGPLLPGALIVLPAHLAVLLAELAIVLLTELLSGPLLILVSELRESGSREQCSREGCREENGCQSHDLLLVGLKW